MRDMVLLGMTICSAFKVGGPSHTQYTQPFRPSFLHRQKKSMLRVRILRTKATARDCGCGGGVWPAPFKDDVRHAPQDKTPGRIDIGLGSKNLYPC